MFTTTPAALFAKSMAEAKRVLFLSPETPSLGGGGGGLRSVSLLEYLRARYQVDLVRFDLRPHSKALPAKLWRNGVRVLRGRPPLLDRFSGYESQIEAQMAHHYSAAVVEHFWCAPYAPLLRPRCDRLILDLHNIESTLARTHASAARGVEALASRSFADAYERLEAQWLPQFDTILVASEEDARRISHPNIHIYPNALPVMERPGVDESSHIVFTGNLEYHPNVEAVRWFRSNVWPSLRERAPQAEWHLVGVNAHAIERWTGGDARIRVIGRVENAVTELAKAAVAVVPLRSGSGTRFKILEAWAAARAVVSTTIGAEGLGARPGEHLLVANDATAFCAAVLRLLNNAPLRAKLGECGRALYLERYTWPAAWRCLDDAGLI
jgi:glycosyltransferase involved in cell wall biosynthesis